MRVYFLPVGQVGGALQDLSLAGIFQKGGSILFGAAWSSDSGSDFGDRCVIVTDLGEIAIFEGSDPASPTGWSLVGRYDVSPPLGRRAYFRAGGDLVIATREGLVPLSAVVTKDPIAVVSVAISRPIAISWGREALKNSAGWTCLRWPGPGAVLVLRPGQPRETWGVAAESGAWFQITGWGMSSAAILGGRLYFARDNRVFLGDATGRDDGAAFVARVRWTPEAGPTPGRHKVAQLARATFLTSQDASFTLSFATSRTGEFPQPVRPWMPISTANRWDVGLWDQMVWDASTEEAIDMTTPFEAVGVSGLRLGPEVTVASDADLPIMCELVAVEALIEAGGVLA